MSRIKILLVILLMSVFFLIFSPRNVLAEVQISCPNRYATLVNPVRGRDLWSDGSLKPLTDQYLVAAKYNFPVTWLLQYDALTDKELVNEINSFGIKGEEGVFLEVSKNLAADANVIYPEGVRWSDPGAVFLSAYSQSDRIRLIDQIFSKYKTIYGVYPKSVGAWWIDSYSLDYMVGKYGVKSALIVADQKVTDSYGVWGQWWGFPYKPSKANILVPASESKNLENAVVIQWAQRDPILAYGGVGIYSLYSLQANDYTSVGKDINYFKSLSSQYLDCKNVLGQITVGLETGMESLREPVEYERQIDYLSTISGLNIVTMSDFAANYSKVYKINPNKIFFGTESAEWEMTTNYRRNDKLGENINYDQNLSFKDYFLKDNSNFLDRTLPIKGSGNLTNHLQWFLIVAVLLGVISIWKKKSIVFVFALLFCIAGFGLIFRSGDMFGWLVFYGPFVKQIAVVQCLLILIVFLLLLLVFVGSKLKIKNKLLLMLLFPLSFGFDRIALAFRQSIIDGNRVVGFLIDRTRIIGLSFGRNGLGIFNNNFSISQILAFRKLPFDRIWQSSPIYFLIYPILHVLIAVVLYFLLIRMPKCIKIFVLIFLTIFFVMQIMWIFNVDPRLVISAIN